MKRLIISSGVVVLLLPAVSNASSFQILEQSPALLGQAFSGTASDVRDATSVYFNPAALGELKGAQFSLGGNAIFTNAKFSDQGSNTGGSRGKTDETGFVPNLYWVIPADERLTFGLGINAPYGLASKYSDDWTGRYMATYSKLELVNANAVAALDLGDYWSLGVGLNYQMLKVTLDSQIDSSLGANPQPATDSSARVKGDDEDLTVDLSLYFKPWHGTRMGLVWREGGSFNVSGKASFELNALCAPGAGYPTGTPPAPTTGTICAATLGSLAGDAHANISMPDTLTFSLSQALSPRWWLHLDIAHTEWSSLKTVDVINDANGLTVSQLDLQYQNTMRYALGASYQLSHAWLLRMGIALDETPQTSPEYLTPRVPDGDRVWFSTGFNVALSETSSLDLGYSYIKVDKARVNHTLATGQHLEGSFDSSVHVLGIQGNWRF